MSLPYSCSLAARLVCLSSVVMALEACSSESCAPAGIYVPSAVRSADPGDCPAGADLVVFENLDLATTKACGGGTDDMTGSSSDGCLYHGKLAVTASSSGIRGTATITVSSCQTSPGHTYSCTANYDLTYTRLESQGGAAAGLVGANAAQRLFGL